MKYKIALITSDEGYAASVPGLPGCWSQGATEEETLANIHDAIKDYWPSCKSSWGMPKSARSTWLSECPDSTASITAMPSGRSKRLDSMSPAKASTLS